jgi:hypothetical protein
MERICSRTVEEASTIRAATSTTEGTNLIGHKNENDNHTDTRIYFLNFMPLTSEERPILK